MINLQMKIVINACFGGFRMSDEAIQLYKKYVNAKDPSLVLTDEFFHNRGDPKNFIGVKIPRYDPCLVKVVEELGEKASTDVSCLSIVEIDDNTDWAIQEYDGYEWISENHKVLTYYPLFKDIIVCGKGTKSQDWYDPNLENGFKKEIPSDNKHPCITQ